jgi:hypothetical protein
MKEVKLNPPTPIKILPPEVAIDVPKSDVASRADADAAMERLSMVKLSAKHIDDCATVGVYLNGVGIIRDQHGGAYVNQAYLKVAMDALMKRVIYISAKKDKIADRKGEIEKLDRLVRALGYTSDKLSKSHKIVLDSSVDQPGPVVAPPPSAVRSFAPRQQIGATSEVKVVVQAGGNLNIHQEP